MDARDATLLAALPVEAASSVTAAVAEAARTDITLAARWRGIGEALRRAFVAVEFPEGLIPVPAAVLSPAQRALVELMAAHSLNAPGGYALPEPWLLRRWLGLEAPTVLEREVEYSCDGQKQRGPLWLALRRDGSNVALVRELPLAERLELDGEACIGAYGLHTLRPQPPDPSEIRDEGRAWAPRYADLLVNAPNFRPLAPLDLLFLSLVRAGIPIEPRWDVLLPVRQTMRSPALFRECLEAIPAERRPAALRPHLGPQAPRFDWTESFELFIDADPRPSLVDALFDTYKARAERPSAKARVVLEAVGRRHPHLARTIAKRLSSRKVARLAFERVPTPPRDALTPLQRKQLAWFERDGGDWDVLEVFIVRDAKGSHVYDATIHAGTDGKVFRARTATAVATFVQGGAEGRGEALMAALEQGLEEYERGRARPGVVEPVS